MIKLNTPIRTEVDEDFFMDISDFRGYARSMMYPDQTGIDMSDELKKLVKRDRKGRIDYSYSDGFDGFRYGQELLCFCDTKTAAQYLGI